MFDKRLFRELKSINAFWLKVTAVAITVVTLTIFQGYKIAELINTIIMDKQSVGSMVNGFVLLAGIMLLRAGAGFIYEHYNRACGIRIKARMRKELVERYIEMGPIMLKNQKAGALVGVAGEGIDSLEPYYSEFVPQLMMATVSTPLVLLVVMQRDWISGVIMLVTVPLIPIFMILIGKMSESVNKKQWKALQFMNGYFLDILRGLTTLRYFGRLRKQGEMIGKINEAFRETTMSVLRISFRSALVLELVATLSTAVIAVSLGLRLIYGHMNFFDAFFILLMAPEFYQPIRQLGGKFHAAMGARSAADSVYTYLARDEKRSDEGKVAFIKPDQMNLEIRNLSFTYAGRQEVLHDLNLDIPTGKKIAFVGPSGGGKSTLIAIIMGFMDDYEGSLTINGKSVRDYPKDQWSKAYAYVPQSPKLFKTSLWENLTMARPEVTPLEVEEVIKKLGLDQLIQQLPEGYDTLIGEGGVAVSGGQAQMISIARALIKGAALVIMDEPTSALDTHTELRINDLLEGVLKDKTVIMIAHRIPTIMKSDLIYFLQQGRVIEKGNHKSLLENKGEYYKSITAWEAQ